MNKFVATGDTQQYQYNHQQQYTNYIKQLQHQHKQNYSYHQQQQYTVNMHEFQQHASHNNVDPFEEINLVGDLK
jgi:hypothetical protein